MSRHPWAPSHPVLRELPSWLRVAEPEPVATHKYEARQCAYDDTHDFTVRAGDAAVYCSPVCMSAAVRRRQRQHRPGRSL